MSVVVKPDLDFQGQIFIFGKGVTQYVTDFF